MNILKGSRVYLAGNMEYTTDSLNWRDLLKDKLGELSIKVLSPMHMNFVSHTDEAADTHAKLKLLRSAEQYDEVAGHMKKIIQQDLRLIDLADYVIFNLEVEKPTFGTLHELVVANAQKKPVFLIINHKDGKKATPLWLLGLIKHQYIYNSIDDVIQILHKIDIGEKIIDSDRWRLLLPELR